MKWKVFYKWHDKNGDIQNGFQEFIKFEDAQKFYKKIVKETNELKLKYGKLELNYNPYFDIKLKEYE